MPKYWNEQGGARDADGTVAEERVDETSQEASRLARDGSWPGHGGGRDRHRGGYGRRGSIRPRGDAPWSQPEADHHAEDGHRGEAQARPRVHRSRHLGERDWLGPAAE